jgi:hypothetical protein
MSRRFVLLELNEVPLRVVQHFADHHPRSAFAKMLARGRRWETVTPDKGHLSPWVTWPTLHRGVPGTKHGIVALGQDVHEVDRRYPPVWDLLTKAGRRVGLFGSLHSYPLPKDVQQYAFYVPDTFAPGPDAHPPELSAFQSFNLHMVDRSGRNVSSELRVKKAAGFLLKTLSAGLRPATLAKVFRQLASERIWTHRSARRRTIQSILAFDLFRAQLEARKPDAAFFFTNHVASAMHRYWPATFAQDYKATSWDDSWLKRFSGEVDYAMGEADQMLADVMDFADRNPDCLVLVSGSMGQAAVDDPSRKVSSEVLVRDMGKFLGQMGITEGWQRRRTMEPTYTLSFDEEETTDRFMEAIATFRIAGQTVKNRRIDAHGVEFILGQSNLPDDELGLLLGNRSLRAEQMGVANVPIADEVGAAAYHVREGMLLVYDPRGTAAPGAAREPVSTTQIAPTLLALQGVVPGAYMERPIILEPANAPRALDEVA